MSKTMYYKLGTADTVFHRLRSEQSNRHRRIIK